MTKLVNLPTARLERRLQRTALVIERRAELGQRAVVRRRFRREFTALPAQSPAKVGKFCFSRLQRFLELIAFGQNRGCDTQMTVNVMLERVAFGFQRIGVLG